MKKAAILLLFIVSAYLLVALFVNLFADEKPDFAKIFVPNSHFGNKLQGNDQTVLGYKKGTVRILGRLQPHAEGPAIHVHTNFDETFSVSEGTLTLLVNGEKKILHAGESFTVSRGVYHKFFNETDLPVTAIGEAPAEFIFMLTQLYGIIDENPAFLGSPLFLLQLSAWGNDFDSYLQAGPPPFVVKTLKFLLLPIAKLEGYQYANPAYFPKLIPQTQKP